MSTHKVSYITPDTSGILLNNFRMLGLLFSTFKFWGLDEIIPQCMTFDYHIALNKLIHYKTI